MLHGIRVGLLPICILLLGVTSLQGASLSALDRVELPHFIDEVMVRCQVPGVAIAVVESGKVVYSGGFGIRKAGSGDRVSAHTIFAVGSTTKAFTSAAAGILVDQGVLDWDEPLRKIMPGFSLNNPSATLHATMRDVLAHRTGLPRHDAVWYRSGKSRKEILANLRHLETSGELRETFTYNNLMYLVAGILVETLSGESWENFVNEKILVPLSMKRTFFAVPDDSDLAAGHVRGADGSPVKIPYYEGGAAAASSSMYSCADDMARWLIFNLGGSMEKSIVKKETLRTIHSPQMIVDQPSTPAFPLTAYGMGWFVQPYRGHQLLWHSGSIDGFYAWIGFLPQDDFGVVVLTNRSRNQVPEVISRWLFDRVLGLREIDWYDFLIRQEETIRLKVETAREQAWSVRDPGAQPTLELAAYAGRYSHPAYGDLLVRFDGERLVGLFHGLKGRIEFYENDIFVFKVAGEIFEDTFQLSFRVVPESGVVSVFSPLQKGVAPIEFVRVLD